MAVFSQNSKNMVWLEQSSRVEKGQVRGYRGVGQAMVKTSILSVLCASQWDEPSGVFLSELCNSVTIAPATW